MSGEREGMESNGLFARGVTNCDHWTSVLDVAVGALGLSRLCAKSDILRWGYKICDTLKALQEGSCRHVGGCELRDEG